MEGIKHIIECQCILPQYKNKNNPVFHKFVVFSVMENDQIQQTYAQCNNCGVVHKITDLCRSTILSGKDEIRSILNEAEIAMTIPSDLAHILESYSCDLATWQHAQFIYNQSKWGEQIILLREEINSEVVGKILLLEGPNKFKIEPFVYGTGIS